MSVSTAQTDENLPRAVTVTVSPQLLQKALGLPPGLRITGAMHDSLTQTIILRLDAPNFPTVPQGAHPMRAQLIYSLETKKSRIKV